MRTNILSKYFSYTVTFFLVYVYAFSLGPVIFMADSFLFAERAKNIAINGTFSMSTGGIIYPPLYAMFMSIGYLFSEPELAHTVILFINVILFSSAYFPIRKILIYYSEVNEKHASILSVILTLSPFMLPYVSMFISEALYFPVLMWFAYYLIKALTNRNSNSYLLTGFFLGLALLVRTASNTLLFALILIAFFDMLVNRKQELKIFPKYILLFLSFIITFGSWKLYETLYVVYKGGAGSYINMDIVRSIYSTKLEIDHHFMWLLNCIKYYFTAPLTGSTMFAFALLICKPQLFKKDLFISFSFITSIGAAFSIVLLTRSDWGGTTLTWNRYLAPYVIFFIFISLKYLHDLNQYVLRILVLAAFFLFLSNAPYNLGCHFPDSLVFFMENLAEWKFSPFIKTFFNFRPPSVLANLVYYSLVLIPIFLFVFLKGFKRKIIPMVIISILFFFANYESFNFWNKQGDTKLRNYQKGIGAYLFNKYKKDKNIAVYIDPDLIKYSFKYFRIQFYVPFEIKALLVTDAIKNSQNNSLYYITAKSISNQAAIYDEDPGIHLYLMKDSDKKINVQGCGEPAI